MQLVIEAVQHEVNAAFSGKDKRFEQGNLGRINLLHHLQVEAGDHEVEADPVLNRRFGQRRVQAKVDESPRLLEDVVLPEEQLAAGIFQDLVRVGPMRAGQGLQRGIFGNEVIRLRQKKIPHNFNRVPVSFPVSWDVLIEVFGSKPGLCLAANVLILGRLNEDVDLIGFEAIETFSDQIWRREERLNS